MKRNQLTLSYTKDELVDLLDKADRKPFVLYYDKASSLYRLFPSEEKKQAWIDAYAAGDMSEEIAAYEFTEPFTAPAPYTINLYSLKDNQYILSGTTGNFLEYQFGTVDGNGGEVSESVDVYYTFKSPSGTFQTSKIYNAGTSVKMNIDDYLQLGTNVITLLVRGRSTGTTKTQVVTYYVVQLDIKTTFDISRSIQQNTNFGVTYTVTGEADKTVEFYIDGTLAATANISSLEQTATRTQIFNNTYQPGKHSLQVRANMMAGDQQFYSKLLYYEFVITGGDLTTTIIQYEFPNTQSILVGSLPGLRGEQYVTQAINWAYYSSNPLLQTATVTWRLYTEGGTETTLATRNADVVHAETDKKPDPLQFMPTETGDYNLQALVQGNIIESYTISVILNTNGILEATEGLVMKLSGLGRSNDEPVDTLTSWADRGYYCTFNNMPFNGNAGYVDNAVVFNNGATGVINCKPYAEEVAVQSNNGNCVEIDFETFNVDDDTAVLFQIGSLESGPCLYITPSKLVLRSRLGTELTARFKSDERVKIAVITHPNDPDHTSYPRMMFLQSNGVLAPGTVYDVADSFNIGRRADTSSTTGMINIGNAQGKAGIKIYYLRVYNTTINQWQELNNYIIDSGGNIAQKIQRNDIFQLGSTTSVDIDKLEGIVPLLKITGDIQPMIATLSKTTVVVQAEYTDPENSDRNFTGTQVTLNNAGQSTLGYHMSPSMHMKFDKNGNVLYDRDGKPWPKNRWAFAKGNVPEKKVRLQANPMDSSGCHNGAFLRMVNQIYPNVKVDGEYVLRIPAQNYVLSGQYASDMAKAHGGAAANYKFPYTINTVPDSRPLVVVWRPDENSSYRMLGDYVMMEEKKANYANGMHSIYDKLLEDGTPDPFDFGTGTKGNRLWDNDGCMQMENLRNHQLTFFTGYNQWNQTRIDSGETKYERRLAYEMIYPDEDDVVQDLNDGKSNRTVDSYWQEFYNEVVYPISNTYHNQSAFDNIVFTKLDKWHLAAYYCLVLRQCCTDSLVRNLEWTRYEHNGKWIPKWWDVDMQLGLQQSGACDAEPMTDRDTVQHNNYVLSGRTEDSSSWLWDALENNTEFLNAVKKMDQALFDAGWTYENIVNLQDNGYVYKWSESLYNLDGYQKYVDSYLKGYNYLTMFQGDRTPHRHWFQKTSYDYWDAKRAVGEYKSKVIYIRARGAKTGCNMHFVAGATSFFGWGQTQDIVESGIQANKGESFTLHVYSTEGLNGNDPVQIYAANKIQEADFNEIARYIWSTIEIDKVYDEVTGTLLKKLIVGLDKSMMPVGTEEYEEQLALGNEATKFVNEQTNIAFTGLKEEEREVDGQIVRIRNAAQKLEWFDIQGLHGLTSVDLQGMANLKTFHAAGSSIIAFNPAPGCDLQDVQLPNTVMSITANGCSFTYNNHNVITWWDFADELDDIPTSLTSLNFTGMGQDVGTQELISAWCEMLRNNPNVKEHAFIRYTNIYWDNIDIDDLLTLASLPASGRQLTGYVKCTTEYTTEQMNLLMEAFGENCFSLTNASSGLCCDCNSSRVIVSASGTNTVVNNGVIEILQGTSATLQAVGFPIIGEAVTYTWYLMVGNSPVSGNAQSPEYLFGTYSQNSLHYRTGVINTTECDQTEATYQIYVESTSLATGSATIKIVPRTYPTASAISYSSSQVPVSFQDGIVQIVANGNYIFAATHTPAGYTGHMTDTNGGVWSPTGLTDAIGTRITSDDDNNKYILNVRDITNMGDDEKQIQLDYTAHWKNSTSTTASPLTVQIINVIEDVLTGSSVSGNPELYSLVSQMGIQNVDSNDRAYSSLELKQLTGTIQLNSANLTTLTSGNAGMYYVPKYMRNATGFDFSGSGLTDPINTSVLPQITSLDITDTAIPSITFTNHTNIADLALPPVSSITLNGCTNLDIDLAYSDVSSTQDGEIDADGLYIEDAYNVESLEITGNSSTKQLTLLAQIINIKQQDRT